MPADTTADSTQPTADQLRDQLTTLQERIADLETALESRDERLERLEAELEETTEENARLRARVDELEAELETCRTQTEARLDAHEKKLDANKDRVGELQARELEKGAHLLADHVDENEIDVPDGRLERIRKDDGQRYFRLPESEDPLERGGRVALAYGDLLPIQQLARMDEEMLRATTSALPSRLAAKLWKARVDSTVGDNPWRKGSAGVREYVSAGDMKHWIRRQETGVSDSYAKKLVSRTIDALLELSKNRLAVKKKRQRKNGLEYTERRVLLMDDADIPGESLETGDT